MLEREVKLQLPLLRSVSKLAVIPDENLGAKCFNLLQSAQRARTRQWIKNTSGRNVPEVLVYC